LQYADGYADAETAFVYLHARFYDPATTQFLSVDPALALTGQPHAYASDSPLENNDPLGLWTGGLCIGEAAAIFEFAVSGCLVFDGNGGVGLEGTYTPPGDFYGSPAAGLSVTGQISDVQTIDSLGGPFDTAGGSFEPIAEGPAFAADGSWGTDAHGCRWVCSTRGSAWEARSRRSVRCMAE
jgi:RHS repeat-associated protein